MNYKRFIYILLLMFGLSFVLIAMVNFIVDPGKIYLQKVFADEQATKFAVQLFKSKYGVVQEGWNERLVKTTLAKSAGKFDCIVLGSSHIMQISSIKNTGNIKKQCNKLLNLGVSGGSIEDIAIFTDIILNNFLLPKKVFIDIDPWTLKFNADSRYGAYKIHLDSINQYLNENMKLYESYKLKYLKNLFNGEYFIHSIKKFLKYNKLSKIKNSILKKEIINVKNKFNLELGYEKAVTLQDGSHVYDKNWIKNQKKIINKIKIGGGNYKIYGEIFEQKALNYLYKIIQIYKKNNIKINFILTPYHPNVFKNGKTKVVKHLTTIENLIKEFAEKYNINVYGSYFPNKLKCNNTEFLDFMHANNSCLNKIDFSK